MLSKLSACIFGWNSVQNVGLKTEWQTLESLLPKVKPCDLVEFHRGPYQHWSIYEGNGVVIHLTGDAGSKTSVEAFSCALKGASFAVIRRDPIEHVAIGCLCRINNSTDDSLPASTVWDILTRAQNRMGVCRYNLFSHNCEHFVHWCRNGEHHSEQVSQVYRVSLTTSAILSILCVLLVAYWATQGYYYK